MLGQVVHRFARNPNYVSSVYNRPGNRHNPFENTLKVLEDPKTGRKLYLIGTTNSSTQLAYRTKELIEKENPDSVFLQTNKKWINIAKTISNVKCQSEMNRYTSQLNEAYDWQHLFIKRYNFRGIFFKIRLYLWLGALDAFKAFPKDFNPFTPGLEMKLALEAAEKQNKRVVLGGLALDDVALEGLRVEPRMDIISLYRNGAFAMNHNKLWYSECLDNFGTLDVQGGETYAESIDKFRANWWVKYFQKVAPYQKKVLVDRKDLDLFYALYRDCPGQKIVAVVNQWHMSGIEAHWRAATGTVEDVTPINPIENFDIEKYMESQLVNDKLRAFTSKITNSEPATWKDYITGYHKDNYEAERIRHVEFHSHDDPHMYHGLPQDLDDKTLEPKH